MMKKILLLTDLSSGYSRKMIKGVVRYSRECGPWIFYRMPIHYRELYGDEGVVKWAGQWKADAIIAQLSDIDVEVIRRLKIPVVIQNYRDRYEGVYNLTGDYYGTGTMAAEFFLRRGFRHFAYYGFSETVWMRERGDGFKHTVRKEGCEVHFFSEPQERDKDWTFDIDRVSRWLRSLPKPVALFACDDSYALQITEVCKIFNLRVPNEISVLGVDNDELLCSISDPPLSSIELDILNGGYELGKLLHNLFEQKEQTVSNVVIRPLRIVARESTERFAVSDPGIENVLKYIDQNYMLPLPVDRIVAASPFSRRVLEKKFRKETGISVYQYVQQLRVDRFAELLATPLPLVEAAFQAGFDDYKNVSRIFSRIKGFAPIQYRKRLRTENDDCLD
ncbi:MAG: DNA-binding transcriptional regulator [Tannerella sp.]|jgi:LacI family transcriptional regulator|nr:DNA-binding transcriptional regulator [Tannerella sp.]